MLKRRADRDRSHLPRPARVLAFAAALLVACSADDPTEPAPPPSALRFTRISAGYFHTCALSHGGAAWCWGGNAFGTLGDGSRTDRTRPARVTGSTTFTHIDAGAGHNCALAADGAAWCWGQNDEGQLGDGTFTARSTPVPVTGLRTFTSVSAGHAHSCALTATGEAWCWGDDSRGQLGDGLPVGGRSPTPVHVASAPPFRLIVAGYYQTCGLTAGGAAWCWGQNDSGQLGDGSITDRAAPVPVSGSRVFSTIDVGDRFACAIGSHDVWCWGVSRTGETGTSGSPDPVRVPAPDARAVVTSAGASTIPSTEPYACVLGTDERVDCWGGAIGQLRARGPAAPLDDRIRAGAIAAGAAHICVLSRSGYAYCGGANFAGQLGDGGTTGRAELVPVEGPGG